VLIHGAGLDLRLWDALLPHLPRHRILRLTLLFVLALAALILGSGLAANVSLLAHIVGSIGLDGTADWLRAIWRGATRC